MKKWTEAEIERVSKVKLRAKYPKATEQLLEETYQFARGIAEQLSQWKVEHGKK